MNKLFGFVMFIAGAAIGSAATWQYTKKKYEQIAQEEIDSVKEALSNRSCEFGKKKDDGIIVKSNATDTVIVDESIRAKEKPSVAEYAAKLQEQGYTNYSNHEIAKDAVAPMIEPYVIPPEEFGDADGYEKISLSYYADKILADEDDETVDDVENTVGLDSLNHFGDYEYDSVFVRNDRLKCDYEILLDRRRYSDVVNETPHHMED